MITPCGGATKAAYVATMLQGQRLNVIVLLDSDAEGFRAAEGLIKRWIMNDRQVLLLAQLVGRTGEASIEDLFPADFYLEYVNRAYATELADNPLTAADVSRDSGRQLVRRVDDALRARGVQPNSEGWAFNKGRPAKLLMTELPKSRVHELPADLVRRFAELFQKINEAMPGLRGESAERVTGK